MLASVPERISLSATQSPTRNSSPERVSGLAVRRSTFAALPGHEAPFQRGSSGSEGGAAPTHSPEGLREAGAAASDVTTRLVIAGLSTRREW
jgi:hypothetical protein